MFTLKTAVLNEVILPALSDQSLKNSAREIGIVKRTTISSKEADKLYNTTFFEVKSQISDFLNSTPAKNIDKRAPRIDVGASFEEDIDENLKRRILIVFIVKDEPTSSSNRIWRLIFNPMAIPT